MTGVGHHVTLNLGKARLVSDLPLASTLPATIVEDS